MRESYVAWWESIKGCGRTVDWDINLNSSNREQSFNHNRSPDLNSLRKTSILHPYTHKHIKSSKTTPHNNKMSTSTSTFKKLAARAKAHHHSLNEAYDIYYSAGRSTSSPGPRPSVSTTGRSDSTSSTSSNLSKTWKSIKKAAKEHHEGMNDAFATYYGGGRRSMNAPSPRGSVSEEEEAHVGLVEGEKEGLGSMAARKVKEHHRSVNAAYRTYYGA
ncbi:hypothetical protein N0V90_005587 [Kalmusia sp. IMI 367209]|nr:hypothetical protein N0V90_005587 [Kalmusia sp. IMI 367209]